MYALANVNTRTTVANRVRASKLTKSLDLLGMALETLPESLSRLSPSLTALHINTNSLSSMPEIELKAVQTLVIRYNQLVSLPTSLGTFAALVTLDASNNSLESLQSRCLTFIGGLKSRPRRLRNRFCGCVGVCPCVLSPPAIRDSL